MHYIYCDSADRRGAGSRKWKAFCRVHTLTGRLAGSRRRRPRPCWVAHTMIRIAVFTTPRPVPSRVACVCVCV